MKSDFHFHFYSRIVIMLVLAMALVLIQQSVRSTAHMDPSPDDAEITGWAWAEAAGWASLNCLNNFDAPDDYKNTCADINPEPDIGVDYGLTIDYTNSTIKGCAWAGNTFNYATTSAVGWVCFSDPGGTQAYSDGIAFSTTYLNALDPSYFASIINQENWRCTGGTNAGNSCFTASDCPFSTCELINDDAWKLGFPIKQPADTDPESTGLSGCFNCYYENNYGCSDDHLPCTFGNDASCDQTGDPQFCTFLLSVDSNCDNCLEYFYFDGRCEDNAGTKLGTCKNTSECDPNEICQPIEVCSHNTDIECDADGDGDADCIADTGPPSGSGACGSDNLCDNNSNWKCPYGADDADAYCDSQCITSDVGSLKKVIGGYECTNCSDGSGGDMDIEQQCNTNTYQTNINSCTSCSGGTYYTPGLILDNEHNDLDSACSISSEILCDNDGECPAGETCENGNERARLCGWAWNGWTDGNKHCSTSGTACVTAAADCLAGEACIDNSYGLGWWQFSPHIVTSTRPYISVESGNIYSRKNIVGKYFPPFGRSNASYLIESGGSITNFVSSNTLDRNYQGELPYQSIIKFPELDIVSGKYSNALGTIDYEGLINDFSNDGSMINKYGADIITDPWDATMENGIAINGLGGAVYYYASGLTIRDNPSTPRVTLDIPTINNSNGSGIIVVNGTLNIEKDVTYIETFPAPSNLSNIASLVWIIRGDLNILGNVKEIVGTFIVLGTPGGNCDGATNEIGNSCGRIMTCWSPLSGCDDWHLTIYGNVIARYFGLERTTTTPDGLPAERFVNDGRLQANPPAGFEDFSRLIPRFTEY